MSDQRDAALRDFLALRDNLFRNPTPEAALAYWAMQGFPAPAKADVPLASVHKARLQWLDVSDAQIAESLQWLREHAYEPTWRGAPPLTPDQRDIDRAEIGKPPLGTRQ